MTAAMSKACYGSPRGQQQDRAVICASLRDVF
jgi:hypothetical protein